MATLHSTILIGFGRYGLSLLQRFLVNAASRGDLQMPPAHAAEAATRASAAAPRVCRSDALVEPGPFQATRPAGIARVEMPFWANRPARSPAQLSVDQLLQLESDRVERTRRARPR